jgi:tetratricopeptide (TPR) repeat protein
MLHIDPLLEPSDPVHQEFKAYNSEFQHFIDSAERLLSFCPNRLISDAIQHQRLHLSARPFSDHNCDDQLIHRRNALLTLPHKTPTDLIRLATISVIVSDFYSAALCYTDLLAQPNDLSIGQRYLASIVLTHFRSWATLVTVLSPVVEHLALSHRADGYFRLGVAYKHLRRFDESASAFRICQNYPPSTFSKSDVIIELSHVYYLQGNLNVALSVFERGSLWTPAAIQQQAFLLLISDEYGKFEMGRQLLTNYKFTNRSSHLQYLRGRFLYKLDFQLDAWHAFCDVLRLDPEWPLGWCAIGNVYVRMGQLLEAAQSYVRAIMVNKDMIEAWLNYAAVIELDPEIRSLMGNFETKFPKMPVTIEVSNGRGIVPTIVEPNDKDRFPAAATLIDDLFAMELPVIPTGVVDHDSLLTEVGRNEMEMAAKDGSIEDDEDSSTLDESESEEESSEGEPEKESSEDEREKE